MATIRIRMEVDLEVEIYHSAPEHDSGYKGCTDAERVALLNPDEVIAEINKMDSDELFDSMI